ncbi:MAG: DUF4365 domain-containing protein [Promethearchaeota archaeon]
MSDSYFNEVLAIWNRNKNESDYGVDFHVQIFKERMATGLEFGVQNKGTDNIGKITNGNIKFSMKTKHLVDYLKLPYPVFLHRFDAQKRQGYWLNLTEYCQNVLDKKKPTWKKQKTVSLDIPISNRLEDLDGITASVIQSRLNYTGKNPISLTEISDIFYDKIKKWTKTSEDFDKEKQNLPDVFAHIIDLHFNRLYYRGNTSVLFPKSEEGLSIQQIHDFSRLISFYNQADIIKRRIFLQKVKSYAEEKNLKLEHFFSKDFQIMGFTSPIPFEELTKERFDKELLRIQNGITFIVMHFVHLFVDMKKISQNMITWIKNLNFYHSEKESGILTRIRLKFKHLPVQHLYSLVDSMFGKIYLEVMQAPRILPINSKNYIFEEAYSKFSEKIKEIGEKRQIDAFIRMEHNNLPNSLPGEQLMVFGFLEELNLFSLSQSNLEEQIKNIALASLDSLAQFNDNDNHFFSR